MLVMVVLTVMSKVDCKLTNRSFCLAKIVVSVLKSPSFLNAPLQKPVISEFVGEVENSLKDNDCISIDKTSLSFWKLRLPN